MTDVLIVSLGSTSGLRAADEQLAQALRRAGADVRVAQAEPQSDVRTLALTDLRWSLAARRAAKLELARAQPEAIVYSSVTAALLWPAPGAIRFDAPAAGNRPGRHGLWQRPLERRRLSEASLLLPWSEGALAEAPPPARRGDRAVVLPVAVEPSGPALARAERDVTAITYAANPEKKGLDRVLDAWRRTRRRGEELIVAGADLPLDEDGVRVVGALPPDRYRALLRRARVYVCAPRREDYGIAQLEALADGCLLVTTPAPGPYAALPVARELDGRLVSDDLASALRTALDDPRDDYAERAADRLRAYQPSAMDDVVQHTALPRLLAIG